MRAFRFFLVALAAAAGVVIVIAPGADHADERPAAPFVTEILDVYRDWRWIESAHEAGNLNSIGAVLGNFGALGQTELFTEESPGCIPNY